MIYLVDTNFLLRLAQSTSPLQKDAQTAFSILRSRGETLIIVPQNIVEFWVVATRPTIANGLGLSIALTVEAILQIKQLFLLQPDTPEVFQIWEELVTQYQVMGKQAHDTRLVAAMIAHQITHLLTFNTADFKRFPEITALTPSDIAI